MTVTGFVCFLGRALLPANVSMPKRYWRWLWAAAVLRLLAGVPFVIILILPYLFCCAFVKAADWGGQQFGNIYVRSLNRDMKRCGWVPPQRRTPAPVLVERSHSRA